jgi:hypothetical protein
MTANENRPPHAPGCSPHPYACTCGAAAWKPTPPPPIQEAIVRELARRAAARRLEGHIVAALDFERACDALVDQVGAETWTMLCEQGREEAGAL